MIKQQIRVGVTFTQSSYVNPKYLGYFTAFTTPKTGNAQPKKKEHREHLKFLQDFKSWLCCHLSFEVLEYSNEGKNKFGRFVKKCFCFCINMYATKLVQCSCYRSYIVIQLKSYFLKPSLRNGSKSKCQIQSTKFALYHCPKSHLHNIASPLN